MSIKNKDKTLVILDLDETLIHATDNLLDREPDFQVFKYQVYKRPHLDEFIQGIKEDFLLAIWSSASDDYVAEITKQIIPEDIALDFVWGRSRCVNRRNFNLDESRYYYADFGKHYHYIKPLKKVRRQGYQLDRILIIDDTPHKSKDNYGNAIYPKEFTGDPQDDELFWLAKYLKTLHQNTNLRQIEKRKWRQQIQQL